MEGNGQRGYSICPGSARGKRFDWFLHDCVSVEVEQCKRKQDENTLSVKVTVRCAVITTFKVVGENGNVTTVPTQMIVQAYYLQI